MGQNIYCFSKKLMLLFCFIFWSYFSYAVIRYVKTGSAGTAPYISWANASNDLQAVINQCVAGDEIWVAQGTYLPTRLATTGAISVNNRGNAFVLKAGVNIYGGFVGNELSRSSRNYTSNITTLSADIGTLAVKTDNCYHVVIAAGAASGNGLLDGFTVSNGYADAALGFTVNGQSVVANRGGGVYFTAASSTVQNCIIKRNEALNGTGGGAVFCSSTASPVMNNCTINGSSTTGGTSHGGGMYMASATATITNCIFSSNTSSGEGGGMYIATTAVPSISNCDFKLSAFTFTISSMSPFMGAMLL